MAGGTMRLRDFGEDNFLFSFFRAITKRKRAGEALRVQGRIIANMSEGVYIIRASDGVIVYTNPKFEQLFGYGPGELVGKNVSIVNAPTEMTPEETAKKIIKDLNEKGSWRGEILNIRKDGTSFWCYASVSVFEHPEHGNVWISMHTDITERKKAEDALRESEERYKTLFQGAAEGIIVADTETMGFKYANPAICKMLGYTEEELVRLGVRDIHPKEDLEYVISEFEAQARGEKTLAAGIRCLRKDGTIMYADIKTAMVLINKRRCNVGFFTDVTERKRIDAELENYKEKVLQAQKHAYISSMGAIVAHQLSQPLSTINMLLAKALELEQAEDNCCPPAFKEIEESLAEAKKATLIIRKFRQYSKDTALETTGQVNVSSTANRIISMLSERAKLAKINISAEILGDLPEVEINEKALEQIFLVIIQNAIEAADGKKQHKLDVIGKFSDGNIKLQFSDDCCGIAPENLDKIFESFFSTKSDGKGIGLGLDIVQQILISCGGEIRVESQFGKGAAFYVTLPISNNLKP